MYFGSLLDLGDCAIDDLPLTQLAAGLGSAPDTANLVYIAPGSPPARRSAIRCTPEHL